jgi:glycosyltransferase involved in cell wall biosynthesis
VNREPSLSYVLITPARNEEAFIELAIRSVVAQAVRPLRWVIVSEGSTDGTDEIVKKYAAEPILNDPCWEEAGGASV